jgi:hypothetical protein
MTSKSYAKIVIRVPGSFMPVPKVRPCAKRREVEELHTPALWRVIPNPPEKSTADGGASGTRSGWMVAAAGYVGQIMRPMPIHT